MTFEEREFFDLNQEFERTAGVEVISIDGDFKNSLKKDLEVKIQGLVKKPGHEKKMFFTACCMSILLLFLVGLLVVKISPFRDVEKNYILSINVDASVLPFESVISFNPAKVVISGLVSE